MQQVEIIKPAATAVLAGILCFLPLHKQVVIKKFLKKTHQIYQAHS